MSNIDRTATRMTRLIGRVEKELELSIPSLEKPMEGEEQKTIRLVAARLRQLLAEIKEEFR